MHSATCNLWLFKTRIKSLIQSVLNLWVQLFLKLLGSNDPQIGSRNAPPVFTTPQLQGPSLGDESDDLTMM
jgi:hypothetical protein